MNEAPDGIIASQPRSRRCLVAKVVPSDRKHDCDVRTCIMGSFADLQYVVQSFRSTTGASAALNQPPDDRCHAHSSTWWRVDCPSIGCPINIIEGTPRRGATTTRDWLCKCCSTLGCRWNWATAFLHSVHIFALEVMATESPCMTRAVWWNSIQFSQGRPSVEAG